MSFLSSLPSSIRKKWNKLFLPRFVVKKVQKCLLLLDQESALERDFLAGRPYEAEDLDTAQQKIKQYKIKTLIDVGSNVGLYTIYLNLMCDLDRNYAFEPLAQVRKRLKINLVLNDLENKVEVFPFALSNQKANKKIYIPPHNMARSSLSLEHMTDRQKKSFTKEEQVFCRVFDELFPSFDSQGGAYVKIDVEGHELGVLYGMKEFLKKNKTIIQVELIGQNKNSAFQFFDDLGYQSIQTDGFNYLFQKGF